MIFRQLFDQTSCTSSYLMASRHGGEALIIDPVLERVDRYIQLLDELDLKLVKAELLSDAETHARYRVRLTLDTSGNLTGTKAKIDPCGKRLGNILLSSQRVNSKNPFFYHKTSRRDLYEAEYQSATRAGFDEVLFLNEEGVLTEASRHNVFLRIDRRIYTPPVRSGLLNGIYRKALLDRCPDLIEKELPLSAILDASSIYLCNAVRGLRKVSGEISLAEVNCQSRENT